MVRVLGGRVVASLAYLLWPRRTTSKSTRIGCGGITGCPPGIVAIDILRAEGLGSQVDRAILVRKSRLHSRVAEVGLNPSRHVVALRTPDKTALRIPEISLSIVAACARNVCALGI